MADPRSSVPDSPSASSRSSGRFWRHSKPAQKHTAACRLGYGPCKCAEHIPPGSVPSPSMYDEYGYPSWSGGFHHLRARTTYWNLLKIVLRRPWVRGIWRLAGHYAWRRWVHRACDTTDFHHDISCLLDPWVRKREAERRYVEVWGGHYATV